MSKIKPTLATKVVDNVMDQVLSIDTKVNSTNLSRAQIKQIIEEMSASRTTGKIILNFDETGNITPEVQLRGDAVLKHFTEKKL